MIISLFSCNHFTIVSLATLSAEVDPLLMMEWHMKDKLLLASNAFAVYALEKLRAL
jgi:hypothetical protein